jgi:hypothetical protein
MSMRTAFLLAIPLLLGAYSVMSRPDTPEMASMVALDEPVDEPAPDAAVSEEELQLYIDVYSAMQLDHSLTVEDAIRAHEVTLEAFRGIERRVQQKSRLVAKVRTALLEQSKQRSAFTEPRPDKAETAAKSGASAGK